MWWVIWSVIALVAAAILWNKIEPEVPEYLKPAAELSSKSTYGQDAKALSSKDRYARRSDMWTFKEVPGHQELAIDSQVFSSSDEQHYQPATLYVACVKNNWYTWVEAGIPLKSVKAELFGKVVADKSGMKVYAETPITAINKMLNENSFTLQAQSAYNDMSNFNVTIKFNLRGLNENLTYFSKQCTRS